MNEKRTYKRFPQSFKEQVVALATEKGYSVAEAARSLGIRANRCMIGKLSSKLLKRGQLYRSMRGMKFDLYAWKRRF